MDEDIAERVIERLLLALAAQLDTSGNPVMTAAAAEALADLRRPEADLIFSQAGLLVHYGTDTEPMKSLIDSISAIQRSEASGDAAIKPGDEVRLVGELPESLAGYNAAILRRTVFVVRYVGRDSTVDIQTDLTEDYMIATVPAATVQPVRQ